MSRKKRLKKNLNSLKSTTKQKLNTEYFWLFSLFGKKCLGCVRPFSHKVRL